MIKSKKLLALGVIAALGVAACGSDDNESAPADTDGAVTTEATPADTEATPADTAARIPSSP